MPYSSVEARIQRCAQRVRAGLCALDPVAALALCWSLFQLWVATSGAFGLEVLHFGETRVRSLHLAFAMLLVFLLFSTRGHRREARPGWRALLLGGVAAMCAAYLALFYERVSSHPGEPGLPDLIAAVVGVVLLLEATRRVLGLGMVVLACLLLAYAFLGQFAPDLIAHKGASIAKAASHLWLTTEGVFGIALGASANFIFMFVLFGALMDAAGGSSYLVRSAMALLGHLRGGPAKAAVFVSAANGLVSGSPVTNVVTTGPVTIPMVKRVGYPPEKAAAIEVASSVNGQMMPPVMGAAAFLMVDFVGVAYVEVLKHALISALVSYLGLLYIVHLEAVKAGLRGLPRRGESWANALARFFRGVVALAVGLVLAAVVAAWVRNATPLGGFAIAALALVAAYVALLRLGAAHVLPREVMDAPIRVLPPPGPTLRAGLYFLLPVGLLVWNLTVERLSPGASAFWATLLLAFIVVTQRPLRAWMLGAPVVPAAREGVADLHRGLVSGALNMVPVAIGTATAGIVIGTFTLTGVGLIMTDLIEVLSGGNVLIMLMMVAGVCLILGTGLTTTTNYILVSTLMVPVIMTIGGQNGLYVPLIAAHLFVFYFGLMADILPPAGLATHAAASIAGANPIRTGVISFRYSLRMVLLPFMFVFNPLLLLIGVEGVGHAMLVVLAATLGGFVFISANQAWLITKSTTVERLVLLLATFMLLNPGLFMDRVHAPWRTLAGEEAVAAILAAPEGERMRILLTGTSIEGRDIALGVLLPLGPVSDSLPARLVGSGLTLAHDGEAWVTTGVAFRSPAAKLRIEPGFRLHAVEVRADGPAREWVFALALLPLGWVVWRQRRRRRSAGPVTAS